MGETESRRRGLYDDFRGYRVPTEAELTEALRTATAMIDATCSSTSTATTKRPETTCWTCCGDSETASGYRIKSSGSSGGIG